MNLAAIYLNGYCLGEGIDLCKVLVGGQRRQENLKNHLENQKKIWEEIVGALLFCEGKDTGLSLTGGLCTRNIVQDYRFCEQFELIDAWESGVSILGKFF